MKIAVVTGFDKPTRPESKGGIEVWTSNFVKEEAKRGSVIDLYASIGSISTDNIRLIPVIDQVLPYYYKEDYFTGEPEDFIRRKEQLISTVFGKTLMLVKEKEDDYDLIIDSSSYPAFSYNAHFFSKPIVRVCHFPVNFSLEFYLKTFGLADNSTYIFPSKFQYDQALFIPKKQKYFIPHGIDITEFEFNEYGGDSLVWMSRIHKRMNKGAAEAMDIASALKKPINIHTYVEPTSLQYYEEELMKHLTDFVNIKRYGINDPIDKNRVLGEAKLFLFPLQWDEPFGLVIVEAMSCGTPVIAFARGSVPEVVVDGQTGFIINASNSDKRGEWVIKQTGIAGLIEAVKRIYSMPDEEYRGMRKAAREHVENRFAVKQMVDGYEEVYKKLITKHG